MSTDPRLAHAALLTLAAFRLHQRRQTTGWEHTVGLAALLDTGKDFPRREPCSLPSLEECSGLARLLAEARQWEEDRRGAWNSPHYNEGQRKEQR